jgi:NitT/TauT family transport system substrate-binding protein
MESKKIAEALQDGTANKWHENLEKLFVATEKKTEIVPADKFVASQPFLNASK